MKVVSVYAVFASAEEAERIGRDAVEVRLAACVNILGPCRSIYRWEGEIETADEVAAIFKTGADQAEALMQRIAHLHSYEVPAIAVWPIEALPEAYGEWVQTNAG